jgi:hypothetical protein
MIDCGATYFSSQSSNTTPWFFFHGRDQRIWGKDGYGNDLGEELLRVAPYLHRGLGGDVLYTHASRRRDEN